jgi:hypothetical protein
LLRLFLKKNLYKYAHISSTFQIHNFIFFTPSIYFELLPFFYFYFCSTLYVFNIPLLRYFYPLRLNKRFQLFDIKALNYHRNTYAATHVLHPTPLPHNPDKYSQKFQASFWSAQTTQDIHFSKKWWVILLNKHVTIYYY